MFERQVDAGGHPGGTNDETADLDHEAGVVVWVVVELDAADIACGWLEIDK